MRSRRGNNPPPEPTPPTDDTPSGASPGAADPTFEAAPPAPDTFEEVEVAAPAPAAPPDVVLVVRTPDGQERMAIVEGPSSLGEALALMHLSGDAYIENRGQPLDQFLSVAELGLSGDTWVQLR